MQWYKKKRRGKNKRIEKHRFRKKHFVDEGKYYELMNSRPRVKELRGLKEEYKRKLEEEKKKKRGES